MNLFGRHKENMTQEKSDHNSDKPGAAGRAPKKEVDLFPALLERKPASALPLAPVRQAGASHAGPQISLFAPTTFDEALDIVECLRSRAATTICLEKMRKVDASRLVDFVAGASAAIDGDFHKLSDQVYLFCPSNMRIVAPGKEKAPVKPAGGGPLDFLYPDRSGADKSPYGGTWLKS